MNSYDTINAVHQDRESLYNQLITHYKDKMLLIARKIAPTPDIAEDCVQEAFICAFEKIHSFNHQSCFTTWLNRIVINQVLMVLRGYKRKSEINLDDILPHFDDTGHRTQDSFLTSITAEHILQQSQTQNIIRDFIFRLPPDYCEILLLRDIQELSVCDTADMLNISISVVKTKLHRARAALKILIEQKFTKGDFL